MPTSWLALGKSHLSTTKVRCPQHYPSPAISRKALALALMCSGQGMLRLRRDERTSMTSGVSRTPPNTISTSASSFRDGTQAALEQTHGGIAGPDGRRTKPASPGPWWRQANYRNEYTSGVRGQSNWPTKPGDKKRKETMPGLEAGSQRLENRRCGPGQTVIAATVRQVRF